MATPLTSKHETRRKEERTENQGDHLGCATYRQGGKGAERGEKKEGKEKKKKASKQSKPTTCLIHKRKTTVETGRETSMKRGKKSKKKEGRTVNDLK